MKTYHFASHLILFTIAITLMVSCGENENPESTEDVPTQTRESKPLDSDSEELPAEKIKELKDSLDQAKTAVSPFLKEGCCSDPDKKTEDCCCEAVYEKYKTMLEEGDPNAIEAGMTDPILANCRKEMPVRFDELENPPSEEDDELDDLFN